MQVKLDDEVLYEIDERMLKLIGHEVIDPIAHVKHLLRYFVQHKCDRCFEKLSREWLAPDENGQSKLLKAGVTTVPSDKREFVDLVQSLPSYKNRFQREEQAKLDEAENKRFQEEKTKRLAEEAASRASEPIPA